MIVIRSPEQAISLCGLAHILGTRSWLASPDKDDHRQLSTTRPPIHCCGVEGIGFYRMSDESRSHPLHLLPVPGKPRWAFGYNPCSPPPLRRARNDFPAPFIGVHLVAHRSGADVKNPWTKKNPFMSMWLSGANKVVGSARGRASAA